MRKLNKEKFLEDLLSRYDRSHLDFSKFEYNGTTSISTVICKEHGEFQITPQRLRQGSHCNKCSLLERGMNRRLTTEEFIQKAIGLHGDAYDYSLTKYISSNVPVTVICKEHGAFSITPTMHISLRKNGCKKCAIKRRSDKKRITQDEFIKRCVETHGLTYDLSETIYRNSEEKVKIICKDHGPFLIDPYSFTIGRGCKKCAADLHGYIHKKPDDYFMEKFIKAHGDRFEYGEIERIDKTVIINVKCKEHGWFKQSAYDHYTGSGCQKCLWSVYDIESFIYKANEVHGNMYDYSKSVYVNSMSKVTITCKKHGDFEQSPDSHINAKQGCPSCSATGPSKGQIEIKNFVSKHVETIIEHKLFQDRRRLDIFIPSLNLAVEYHGLIWHSTKFAKDSRRDSKKHNAALKLGVRIIHIYEDEWLNKKDIVKKTLLSAIGKNERVFARKCVITEIEYKVASEFFDANHLQGAPRGGLTFGLEHEGELVAAMSFCVARSVRGNTNERLWELQRYASTCSVVGGASKLFAEFLRNALCDEVISYSDNRLFSGKMYEKLGFKLEHEVAPDYWYVTPGNNMERKHKSNFQKERLKSMFENYDENLSESENCKNNSWYQVFDCGKKKWSYKC